MLAFHFLVLSTAILAGCSNVDGKHNNKERKTTTVTEKTDIRTDNGITFQDGNGKILALNDLKGKVVFINFWATWCPPCKSEMPDFDRVYADYGDDVVFMMINMTDGSRDTVESAAAFVADNGYSFPVYYDCDLNAAYTYGVSSIPMTVLVGADGNIIGVQVGALNEAQLRSILDTYITPANN